MEEFPYVFERVEDPGQSNTTRHDLPEMLMIGLLSKVRGRRVFCYGLVWSYEEGVFGQFHNIEAGHPEP